MLNITVGPGNDMHRHQFADAFGGRTAGIRSRLYRADIAAHKNAN
jgi:hypothetical protein